MTQREYFTDGEPLYFKFEQNREDFIVDEIPREFGGKGKNAIVLVKKTDITTWDMIAAFARYIGIDAERIGYAGLKDKHATTTQYISMDAKYIFLLKRFEHKNIKILNITKDKYSIRMGDLVGNRFRIRLNDVDEIMLHELQKRAKKITKYGVPNYFGYQRFGRDESSLQQAKDMISGELFIEDNKLKKFLISIYQSDLYNKWLQYRVALSKKENLEYLKLFEGDVYSDFKGKLFTPKNILTEDFLAQKVTPTGLLAGRSVYRARAKAREIEKKFDDEFLYTKGERREAVVFPKNITFKYAKSQQSVVVDFSLPKGSYATVVLEALSNRNLKAKKRKNF